MNRVLLLHVLRTTAARRRVIRDHRGGVRHDLGALLLGGLPLVDRALRGLLRRILGRLDGRRQLGALLDRPDADSEALVERRELIRQAQGPPRRVTLRRLGPLLGEITIGVVQLTASRGLPSSG